MARSRPIPASVGNIDIIWIGHATWSADHRPPRVRTVRIFMSSFSSAGLWIGRGRGEHQSPASACSATRQRTVDRQSSAAWPDQGWVLAAC